MKISETHKLEIKKDGKIASRIYVRIPENKSQPIYISRLWTKKDYRRQGLATKVLREVISVFGNRQMKLIVSPEKGTGITKETMYKFYSKFGFVKKKNTQTMIRETK